MGDLYYGVYLIPPPALVVSISQAHTIMAAEWGARTAPRFMAHCTLKGFTKLAPDGGPDALIPVLDALFAQTPAFPTSFQLWVTDDGKFPGGETAALLLEK